MLVIRDLAMVYANGHRALNAVSFQVERGEIVAIIGRSGAGKSTLLRCINGLQRPTAGSIQFGEQQITSMDERALEQLRSRIGFIWQEYNLVDRLPVLTNVLTGRLGYHKRFGSYLGYFDRSHREIALRSLERVNLLSHATQRADRLSGGEKQRVAIARAMSQEPQMLLADEPVASLDPELAWQVMGDLARVAREDRVLTLINIHQVELAKAFADRIIGIAQGHVVFDGTPNQLDQAALDRVYRFDKPAALAVGA